MMGGILNSDTDSLTNANTTGGQGGAAPGTGINTVNDDGTTSISIVNNQTDHGIVSAGLQAISDVMGEIIAFGTSLATGSKDLVDKTLNSNEYLTKAALDANTSAVVDSLAFGKSIFQTATDLVRDTTYEAFDFGRESLDTVRDSVSDVLATNSQIAGDALYQSQKTIELARDLNEENSLLFRDTVRTVASTLQSSTGQVVQSLTDLEEERTIQNAQVLNSVKGLAETVRTGGENISQGINKAIVFAGLALAGFTVWRLAR